MSQELTKGGDQHQVELTNDDLKDSSVSVTTPGGVLLVHGDHGLTPRHLQFVDEIMAEFEEGTFICQAFKMPDSCPGLFDNLYGPVNGDAPVTDEECYFEQRGDRKTVSRLLDRLPRPGARWMVIIGLAQDKLWTAYGSIPGVVAHREKDDPTLTPEGKLEAEKFWAEHALAVPR